MSNTFKSVLLPAAMLAAVEAHVCMWSPLQRGGAFELVIPGQSICYLKQPSCGGTTAGPPLTDLTGGSQFELLFQQNLNHFYQENPGKLIADFATVPNPTEDDFFALEGTDQVADWNGMNMITQSNFSLSVTIPNLDCDQCVLRMRYVSNNPTEDHGGSPTFHQCADVTVKKTESKTATVSTVAVSKNETTSSKTAGQDCCAPKQFTMEGYENSDWRNPTRLKYFFDAENELFRIDQDSGSGLTVKDGRFQMFNDFKAGIEYYYNVNDDSCELYGLNLWNDWCYGSVNSQVWRSEARVGDQLADVWGMDGNDYYFTNTQQSCTPVSKARSSNGETTHYFNMVEGAPEKGFFDLPAACESELKRHTSSKNSLQASPRSIM